MQEEGNCEPTHVGHQGVNQAATHSLLVGLAQQTLPAVRTFISAQPSVTLVTTKFSLHTVEINDADKHMLLYSYLTKANVTRTCTNKW